jgi:hypothetical protein
MVFITAEWSGTVTENFSGERTEATVRALWGLRVGPVDYGDIGSLKDLWEEFSAKVNTPTEAG